VTTQTGPKRQRYDKNFTFWCRITKAKKKEFFRNASERKVKADVFILGGAPFSLTCRQKFHF